MFVRRAISIRRPSKGFPSSFHRMRTSRLWTKEGPMELLLVIIILILLFGGGFSFYRR